MHVIMSSRVMISFFGGLLIAGSVQADTKTWSASATTTSWALDSNWVGGIAPAPGDDVVIFGNSNTGGKSASDNSAYVSTNLNSLTLKTGIVSNGVSGDVNVNLSSALMVGAGGITNSMASNSLFLGPVTTLTADQVWGGTRTIFTGAINGNYKLTMDGSGMRIDSAASTFSGGFDVRTSLAVGGYGAGGTITTGMGTGPITLINQKLNGTTRVDPTISFGGAASISSSAPLTVTNAIVLLDTGSGGNFGLLAGQDVSPTATNPCYIVAGNISGIANASRTLTLSTHAPTTETVGFILTGSNTYNAVTIISTATTLQIGNGGSSGTLGTGAVTDNGTLAFNRSDTLTVTNPISGTGIVIQKGTGTTALTGANTFTAGTIVSNGTLWANNISGSATGTNRLTVASGATLGGVGMITGAVSVSSSAYLKPGTNSIGTLTVGSLTINSNATFEVQLGGTANYDQCVVTQGAIDITGSTLSVLFANGALPGPSDSFTIIRNIPGAAVTGRFLNDTDFKVPGIKGVFSVTYTGDIVLHYRGNLGTCIRIR